MTEERKGQIALLIVRAKFRDDGLRLKPDLKRELANTAKKIGVPPEEFLLFAETLIREAVAEVFPPRTVATVKPDHNREM